MSAAPDLDMDKARAFLQRCLGEMAGTMTLALATIGDRLGLFAVLADGPASAAELAQRAGVQERYGLEWLRGMTAAGYLERGEEDRYVLPPEHVAVLAKEGSPVFLCGGYQMLPGMLGPIDRVVECFRDGGGVTQSEYGDDVWDGMQRFSGAWYEHLLLGDWLPAMPEVRAMLERGASAADVGCGSGRAAIALAKAFPASTFAGFDAFPAQVERAQRNADAAGVGDRVSFEVLDGSGGLPGRYDLVTTFDVIHDAVDPAGLLRAIRAATADDGRYVMLEVNCADDPDDNVGPIAALHYGFSVTYCMTTSLANGGAGLGTCGMPEARVREMAAEAGFSGVRRAPIKDNPFNAIYEISP